MSHFDTHFLGNIVIYLFWLRRMGLNNTYDIVYGRYYNEIGMWVFNKGDYEQ